MVRPKLPAALRRSCSIRARLLPSELDAIQELADRAGVSLSRFVVDACIAVAGRESIQAHTEKVFRKDQTNRQQREDRKKLEESRKRREAFKRGEITEEEL